MITLLDYGAGNVRSVINAVRSLGEEVRVAADGADILSAEKLIFPGVGAFGSMMAQLRRRGFVDPLKTYLAADRPFLGICLGLQALFERSEEAPGVEGLGILPGYVRRFRTGLSVPHIGWNGLRFRKPSFLFNGLAGDEPFYFVHSYHVVPDDERDILTLTDYGEPFVSGIRRGNLLATQFHPEKSGRSGLTVLKHFLNPGPDSVMPHAKDTRTCLVKRIVAALDVRANDQGDLVVTKGNQYDVREKGLVRNLGKPVDLARRYYEEGADEIAFLNITGFRQLPLNDLPLIEVLKGASENVFVPLTIGGGIRDYIDTNGCFYSALEIAAEYFRSGADKISIGGDAVTIVEEYLNTGEQTGESAIERIARVYGNQAVVVSIDPRRVYVDSPGQVFHQVIETETPGPGGERFCWHQCTVKGGREGRDVDAVTVARICEKLGAGEILLNSIDRDGAGLGFDIELIRTVKQAVSIPVIASSGAGCPRHFLDVFTLTDVESALAAGIFHRREVAIRDVKACLAGRVAIRH